MVAFLFRQILLTVTYFLFGPMSVILLWATYLVVNFLRLLENKQYITELLWATYLDIAFFLYNKYFIHP